MLKQKLNTPLFQAFLSALLISGIFFIFSSVYIYLSGVWGLENIETIEEFQKYETAKGLLFVALSALILFSLLFYCLFSIQKAHRQLQENQNLLLSSQRQAMTGLLMASIAHDSNNILQSINFSAEKVRALMGQTEEPSATMGPNILELKSGFPQEIDRLLRGLDNLTQLARQMRQVGEQNSFGERSLVNLRKLTQEGLDLLSYQLKAKGVQLQLIDDLPESLAPYEAYPTLIQQMLINLVLNASEAVVEQQGLIEVHLKETSGSLLFEVHDNGPGVGETERQSIFSPFTSSKGQGRGLGLLSVKMCAEAHNGDISLSRSPLGGACFRVSLPRES